MSRHNTRSIAGFDGAKWFLAVRRKSKARPFQPAGCGNLEFEGSFESNVAGSGSFK